MAEGNAGTSRALSPVAPFSPLSPLGPFISPRSVHWASPDIDVLTHMWPLSLVT